MAKVVRYDLVLPRPVQVEERPAGVTTGAYGLPMGVRASDKVRGPQKVWSTQFRPGQPARFRSGRALIEPKREPETVSTIFGD